uniref:Putative nuclease HARBI1 n=1 Tax=Latimeria chalumnae TaxID=7897 RepID=H3BGY9_LATCH
MAEFLLILRRRAALREKQESRRRRKRERIFRPRITIIDMPDEMAVVRYRLDKQTILDLCQELRGDLEPITNRSKAIPVHVKLLAVLNFYATGSYQHSVGDGVGMSQPTFSRCLNQVTAALKKRVGHYIYFPKDKHSLEKIKQDFCSVSSFPDVLGAVDCIHVALKPPAAVEHLFRNKKLFHSMNMQVVCDATCTITNVVANYPGATHDSYIFNNCCLKTQLQNKDFGEGWLLGM